MSQASLRDFFALLSGFRKADSDRLLFAGHLFAASTALQGAPLPLSHGGLDIFGGALGRLPL